LVPGRGLRPDRRRRAAPAGGNQRNRRGWEIPRKTNDPELARRNLLERDRVFTDRLFEETKRLKLRVIEIDTTMNEGEVVRQMTQAFGL
jgi:hypothetical protein